MAEGFEIVPKLAGLNIAKEVLSRIPARLAKEYKIFPIEETETYLKIAMVNPYDLQAIDDIQLLAKKRVKPVKTPLEEIENAINKYYGLGASAVEKLAEEDTNGKEATGPVVLEATAEDIDVMEGADDAVVVNFVNNLLQEAVRLRASDMHIEPLPRDIRIRFRVDGMLREAPIPPQIKRFRYAIISRVKIMARMDIAERRVPLDGRIEIKTQGQDIDCRVNSVPTLDGESVAIRFLNKQKLFFTMDEIGLLPDLLEQMKQLIKAPNGIILVSGPTGSGKSTTLAAVLSAVNTVDRKIITVEEPVEYQLPGVDQINVNEKVGLTFASALRAMLRQNPNVIMVGEIRDPETAEIAIRGALTGHLVFSTVHTNDAPGTMTRLVDMGVEPYLVASAIRGILAQRLVRTICPSCKITYKPTKEELEQLKLPITGGTSLTLAKGKGCDKCLSLGYLGRMAIFELFVMNESIEDLILQKAPTSAIRDKARQIGMKSLREDGWEKAKQQLTTVEEVLRVTAADVFTLEE